MKKKCCAGIVTCNPELKRLTHVVDAVSRQVDIVIIVDNCSENKGDITKLLQGNKEKNIFVENDENRGIARALNQIFEVAVKKGYDWVLTLDHDTVCDPGMVETLFKGVIGENVGIVCPSVLYEDEDLKMKGYGKLGMEEVYACMTSGSLTRVSAWEKVGGFNDNYFIDFVDNEFCMKLKIDGFKVIRNHSCEMKHSLGEPRQVKSLFGSKSVSIHKPWRYYYMVRNNLTFIRQYRPYLRIIKEYAKLLLIIWDGVRYSYDRKQTLHYIGLGIRDARNGITGRMKELKNV